MVPQHPINYASYFVQCNKYALEALKKSAQEGTLPSRLGHIWVFSKAVLSLPIFLTEKIVRVATFVFFQSIKSSSSEFDKKKSLDSTYLEAVYLGKTTVSFLYSIFASLKGVFSPEDALSSWQNLAQQEYDYWQKKSHCFSEKGAYLYEMPINSAIVNIYLGYQPEQRSVFVRNCYWTAKVCGTGNTASYYRG